jgi:glycosyltransferase involved in cell wall biosynthesis
MHVTIGIITRDRPGGLARLLESIGAQRFDGTQPEIEILVVDNDPSEGARDTCRTIASTLPFALRYEIEPRRGIPHARNAVIDAACKRTDFIAYVDDDETVDPGWLAELLRVRAETAADVVTGPAVPRLPDGLPDWLASAGAFDLLRYRTGEPRPFAFTHNVRARREVYETVRPCFDVRLTDSGGSDTHFFRRVRAAGFSIVWADDAVAHEWIPASRARVGWLLRRALRIGGTDAFIERDLSGYGAALRVIGARAARHAVRGVLRVLSLPARGRAALLEAGQDGALTVGLIAGLFGYRHPEYGAGR